MLSNNSFNPPLSSCDTYLDKLHYPTDTNSPNFSHNLTSREFQQENTVLCNSSTIINHLVNDLGDITSNNRILKSASIKKGLNYTNSNTNNNNNKDNKQATILIETPPTKTTIKSPHTILAVSHVKVRILYLYIILS